MSVGLEILLQLSVICQRDLLRGKRNEGKLPTARLTTSNSLTTFRVRDASRSPDNYVKFQLDGSKNAAEVSSECDCDTTEPSEPSSEGIHLEKETDESRAAEPEKITHCSVCNLTLSRHTTYITHLLTDRHLGLISCDLCGKKETYNEMEKHWNSVHSSSSPVFKTVKRLDDGRFHCTRCDLIFALFHDYKKHTQSVAHRGKTCRRCNFVPESPEEYEEHCRNVHQDDIVLSCGVCRLPFPSSDTLEKHILSVHGSDKPFKCATCGACFTRLYNLQRHQEIHTIVRKFPCDLCTLSFKYKRNLVAHKAVHREDRYQCPICFRSFSDEPDYENHVKTHEGKLFVCMVCGKEFTTYHRREMHFKTHLKLRKKRKCSDDEGTLDIKAKPKKLRDSTNCSYSYVDQNEQAGDVLGKDKFFAKCDTSVQALERKQMVQDHSRNTKNVKLSGNNVPALSTKLENEQIGSVLSKKAVRKTQRFSSARDKKNKKLLLTEELPPHTDCKASVSSKIAKSARHMKAKGACSEKTKENCSPTGSASAPQINCDLIKDESFKRKSKTSKDRNKLPHHVSSSNQRKQNHPLVKTSSVLEIKNVSNDSRFSGEQSSDDVCMKNRKNVSKPSMIFVKQEEISSEVHSEDLNVCFLTEEKQRISQGEDKQNCTNVGLRYASSLKNGVDKKSKTNKKLNAISRRKDSTKGRDCTMLVRTLESNFDHLNENQIIGIEGCDWGELQIEGTDGCMTLLDQPCEYIHEILPSGCDTSEVGIDPSPIWYMDPTAPQQAVILDAAAPTDGNLSMPLGDPFILADDGTEINFVNCDDFAQNGFFTFEKPDGCPLENTEKPTNSTKKRSRKKETTERTRKKENTRYPHLDGKKVLMTNLHSDEGYFCLPEFIIEDGSSE